MVNRGKCHDMDKLLCSLSYPQLTADYFHRMFNGHHEESMIELQDKSKRLSGLTIVFNRNRVGRDDFFKCIIPIKRELVKNGKYQMKWIVGSIDYLERYTNLKEMNKGYYSYRNIMERIGDK